MKAKIGKARRPTAVIHSCAGRSVAHRWSHSMSAIAKMCSAAALKSNGLFIKVPFYPSSGGWRGLSYTVSPPEFRSFPSISAYRLSITPVPVYHRGTLLSSQRHRFCRGRPVFGNIRTSQQAFSPCIPDVPFSFVACPLCQFFRSFSFPCFTHFKRFLNFLLIFMYF